MANERLRNALRSNNHTERTFAEDLGVDPKTVQRWITTGRVPHQSTAQRAAKLLDVPMSWLWPDLERPQAAGASAEVVGFYPHRSESPKQLWSDLLLSTHERLDLVAFASLFLPEENPESIEIIKYKASKGVKVRIALGEPGTPELKLRGREERLFDAIDGRVRMALAYYRPLVGVAGIDFHVHTTTLYNSIFRFDDQMLINQHIFGTYGYMAPILHLRRCNSSTDLFDTYATSFERIWEESKPYEP
ncbi:helix-turn-helix domain-containing protein [Micromonospora narathiwatensis]|uniref:Helix-turn-helix n=1 Tax=Micromonospora narathiwatensis TaxID=299146 RepID=A0A1A8ZDF2_9ACTN|nr:helix-turn-helix transcriptional regulator [Micromonospora narathiwatensis]SBT41852.1 Helix-turn-helix [Micromonospora narathiwatensis]